jgi:hypothetical protein
MLNQVLNLIQDLRFQHLTKSWTYETLKRVQGDRLGLFTRPSWLERVKNGFG